MLSRKKKAQAERLRTQAFREEKAKREERAKKAKRAKEAKELANKAKDRNLGTSQNPDGAFTDDTIDVALKATHKASSLVHVGSREALVRAVSRHVRLESVQFVANSLLGLAACEIFAVRFYAPLPSKESEAGGVAEFDDDPYFEVYGASSHPRRYSIPIIDWRHPGK